MSKKSFHSILTLKKWASLFGQTVEGQRDILEEKSLGYKTKSYTGIRLREARFAKEVMLWSPFVSCTQLTRRTCSISLRP